MSTKSDRPAMAKLKALGYGLNKDGVVCKIDQTTNKLTNERFQYKRYSYKDNERFDSVMNEVLYELLEVYGLKRTYIPENLPQKKGSLFFAQPERLRNSKKLVIIMSGYAGKWSWDAVTYFSLKHGSQLNYIRRAQALGYDVLVTNNFQTQRLSCGKMRTIPGLRTCNGHTDYIWKHYVLPAQPESVAIIAANGCGQMALTMAELYPEFFKTNVFGIAFLDSWHNLKEDVFETVGKYSCNWRMDSSPLDTEIPNLSKELRVLQLSAGPKSSDLRVPYVVCKSVFRFLEAKYLDFKAKKRNKV